MICSCLPSKREKKNHEAYKPTPKCLILWLIDSISFALLVIPVLSDKLLTLNVYTLYFHQLPFIHNEFYPIILCGIPEKVFLTKTFNFPSPSTRGLLVIEWIHKNMSQEKQLSWSGDLAWAGRDHLCRYLLQNVCVGIFSPLPKAMQEAGYDRSTEIDFNRKCSWH